MKNVNKNERGSVSTLVLVTVLFFVIMLSAGYAVVSAIRRGQLQNDLQTKEAYEKDIKLLQTIKVGDEISYSYDTASSSYSLTKAQSGYSSDQTVTQTTGLKWKVINIDYETLTVDAVATSPTSSLVYLQGALGYNNGTYLLNDICAEQYSNKTLGITARNLNLEDLEKIMVSTTTRNSYKGNVQYGTTKTYTDASSYYPKMYASQIGAGINTTSVIQPVLTNPDPFEESTKKENVTTDTFAQASTSGLTVTQTYYTIDINSTNYGSIASTLTNTNSFWVASKYTQTDSSCAYFGIRYANSSLAGEYLCSSAKDETSRGCYLRPIISINTTFFTGEQNSSEEWILK